MTSKSYPLWTLLLLLSVGLWVAGCAEKTAPAADAAGAEQKTVRKVKSAAVNGEPYTSKILSTGTALPARESYLSFSVPGTLLEIKAPEGTRVKKGQVLARLDPSDFQLTVQTAQAAVEAAEKGAHAAEIGVQTAEKGVELSNVQRNLMDIEMKRASQLRDSSAAPQSTYDRTKSQSDAANSQNEAAKSQLESIRAQAEAMKAQVQIARLNLAKAQKALDDTQLRAPYDGVVVSFFKEIGEYAPSMPPTIICKVVDDSSLEVQTFLSEVESVYVKTGQKGSITVQTTGVTAEGEVFFVSDRVEQGTQTFEVRFRVDNSEGRIKAGSLTHLSIDRAHFDSALLVPVRSILRDDRGQTFVFVLKGNTVARTAVTVGETVDSRVLVLNGLASGSRVVATGVGDLQDGQTVEAVDEEAKPGTDAKPKAAGEPAKK